MNSNSQSNCYWHQSGVLTDKQLPENFNTNANEFNPNFKKASQETVMSQFPSFYPNYHQKVPTEMKSQQPVQHQQASSCGTAGNFYQMIYYQQPFVDQNGTVTHYMLTPQQWQFIYQNYPEYSSNPYDLMHWLYQKSISQQQIQFTNFQNCSLNQQMAAQFNGQVNSYQQLPTQYSPYMNSCLAQNNELTSQFSSIPTTDNTQTLLEGLASGELDAEDIALIKANAESLAESDSEDQDDDIDEWERQFVNQCIDQVELQLDENENNENEPDNTNVINAQTQNDNAEEQYQLIEIEIEIDGQPNEDDIDNASVATADQSDHEDDEDEITGDLEGQELNSEKQPLQITDEKVEQSDNVKLDLLQLDDLDANDQEFKIAELDFD